MAETLEVLAGEEGGKLVLRSPGVGTFTCALPEGHAVVPGQVVGVLTTLGRSRELRVPAGPGAFGGRIASAPLERVLAPVGFGDVLYELTALEGTDLAPNAAVGASDETDGLAVRAPQTGRCRPAAANSTGASWRFNSPSTPSRAACGRRGDAHFRNSTHIAFATFTSLPLKVSLPSAPILKTGTFPDF